MNSQHIMNLSLKGKDCLQCPNCPKKCHNNDYNLGEPSFKKLAYLKFQTALTKTPPPLTFYPIPFQ